MLCIFNWDTTCFVLPYSQFVTILLYESYIYIYIYISAIFLSVYQVFVGKRQDSKWIQFTPTCLQVPQNSSRTFPSTVYRVAQKSLDTRFSACCLQCQGISAPRCIVWDVDRYKNFLHVQHGTCFVWTIRPYRYVSPFVTINIIKRNPRSLITVLYCKHVYKQKGNIHSFPVQFKCHFSSQ